MVSTGQIGRTLQAEALPPRKSGAKTITANSGKAFTFPFARTNQLALAA